MPAKIIASQSVTSVYEGEPLFLGCLAEGHPPPSMAWFRSRDKSTPWPFGGPSRQEMDIAVSERSTDWQTVAGAGLFVTKASGSHAGHYSCHANNSLGRDVKEMELRVFGKPSRLSASQSRRAL